MIVLLWVLVVDDVWLVWLELCMLLVGIEGV